MKVGEILKEKDGKISFARFTGFILLIWTMILLTYISVKTQKLHDIPTAIALLIAGLYGINKLGETIQIRRK